MATHCNILAWKSHGQRTLAGYSPRGCKESDMTKQLTLSSNNNKIWRIFPFLKINMKILIINTNTYNKHKLI